MEEPVTDPTERDALLVKYKRLFAEARDLLAENRKEQQIDDDYYHGYQLTKDERDKLRERKQPDTVFNRYRKAVNGTLGVLKQGATDPRAYGRTPNDDDAAETVTKILRYCADINEFNALRIDCSYDYLVPGHAAVEIGVDENGRPKVEQVRWEEFFYDPRSRKKDFTDARYMGVAKWMYADDLAGMFPDANAEIDSAMTGGWADDTWEDRPRDSLGQWIDRKARRLMVVMIYHQDGGQWNRCLFHAGGILHSGPSPYVDEKGKPANGIVAQACYVDRENNRMGIGRDMRSPQDEFNKRRQKLLHMLNNRQVQAASPDVALAFDADLVRAEASRPDGVLPPGWQTSPMTDLASGQFQLLAMAEGEMDREGPNPAILGRQGESQSGRAQLVRQQAGLTEQAIVFGGIEAWELRVYRAMWNRCKQYWTAPDYVRITDDEGAPQFIGVNQPVHGPAQVVMGPDGMPAIQPQVLGYDNALAELDVDITLDTVPDTANLAQEQFLALVDLAKAGVAIPPQLLIESSSLPKKREILDKMKAQAEQPDPQRDLATADAQSKIENTQANTQLTLVKASVEAMKPHIDAMQAGAQAGAAAAQTSAAGIPSGEPGQDAPGNPPPGFGRSA
jgi:hypothetical protein